MEDRKNTDRERTENNMQRKQSEGGVEWAQKESSRQPGQNLQKGKWTAQASGEETSRGLGLDGPSSPETL